MQNLSLDALCSTVRDAEPFIAPDDGPEYLVSLDGKSPGIPIKLLSKAEGPQEEAPLVFIFHGGIDQRSRPVPNFMAGHSMGRRLGSKATIICVADPTLRLDKNVFCGWYAGDHEVPTQSLLRDMVAILKQRLNPSRIIFHGGSIGAHPAALQSLWSPGSLCVLVNPLIKIRGYNKVFIQQYFSAAWPGVSTEDVYASCIVDNIIDLYSAGHENTVILIQNAFDHHFTLRVMPFAATFKDRSRFLFISECFPGHFTHYYPGLDLFAWTAAAIDKATEPLTEIAVQALKRREYEHKTLAEMEQRKLAASIPQATTQAKVIPLDERDLAISRMLASAAPSNSARRR